MFKDFSMIKSMTDFKREVDTKTELWLSEPRNNQEFEFYTDGENLKEKHLYLSQKQAEGCFWDLYHARSCGLDKDLGTELFHVVIDLKTSCKDPIYQFKKLTDTMTEEYVNKNGDVTCEFSTSSDNLHLKHQYLHSKQKDGVIWTINLCATCEGHKQGQHYHVEIAGFIDN